MSKSFTGKVALVTGASAGIGRATAELFAERGASVAAAARDRKRGQETVDRIRASGGVAELVTADMENADEIRAMVARTVDLFGRLDCAFNNAGMVGDAAALHQTPPATWDKVIATNLTAVFLCMKYEIEKMVDGGGGTIVNNSSGAGVCAQEYLSPYAAAKHGVLGLTKTAAREYAARGIRVNAVCPGLTDTPQLARYMDENPGSRDTMIASLPMKRMADPKDIANAVVWLSSADACYVSGESMLVDGALICR